MKYSRDFKGVWIPREIWLTDKLTLIEKALLVEIDSLSSSGKPCFASNQHFAEFLNVSKRSVIRYVQNLKDKGYIEVSFEYEDEKVKRRFLKVTTWNVGSDKLTRGGVTDWHDPQCQSGTDSNNNKSNNSNSNTDSIVERQTAPSSKLEQATKIIGYLNKRVGTHYRATTRKTQTLIKARLNEGFTVDDFKRVIDNKADEWLGDQKMEKYLRPETLFGTKFEGYLNERSTPRVGGDGIVVGTDYAKLAREQDEDYQKSLENLGEVHDKELPF
ncbi:conserved phage C-terminal domain-containing protein [Ligilactobacillus sp. LYQ139]|uniref:conserved phage C-terminal domain-containing protein n=1 Tax=Ligilactobacillus sp. LYQ139 TaxID=3378800 RepID=UPI003852B730